MKSVLISIQPYWVFLIIAKKMGWNTDMEKTVEVRKTHPRAEGWNKTVEIYCSKDKKSFAKIPKEYQPLMKQFLGKVIGEFVCHKITEFYPTMDLKQLTSIHFQMCEKSCVNMRDLYNYANGKILYSWYISDLVMYDKPKELSEFSVLDDKAIKDCKHRERIYVNPDSVNGAWLKGGYICTKGEEDWCSKCKTKPLKRPPQSWCYVEKLKG